MSNTTSTRTAAAINTVARETLRRIAAEQISPTPETYMRIYREIAATHPDHPEATSTTTGVEGKSSAKLIARLLTQLESHHAGITVTRKREGLKRALVPRLEPLEALYARLERLMDSWNGPNAEAGHQVSQFLGTEVIASHTDDDADRLTASQIFPPAPPLFPNVPPSARGETRSFAPPVRASHNEVLPERLISFRLAGLLAMLLKNIDQLTPESALLGNQIEQIGRVLTAPLTEKKLDEAERCLRALIARQGAIQHSIDETKRAIRELAETLLGRLSTIVTSTDSFSNKLVDMSERIAATNDLGQLSTLTQMLVTDAQSMSASVAAERTLLMEAESRARHLQERTTVLEGELREASTLVRTDPLTRALNRRGFGDAYKGELVRAEGRTLPAVALIDVDNFKRINEEHGHSVGDEVLCSVVEVLHRCASQTVTVARYGGEEFALLFPEMSAEQTELAIIRMQRALTDHLRSPSSHLPVITFSAGIARVEPGETLPEVMTRADRALREAKRAGKNCTMVASQLEAPAV